MDSQILVSEQSPTNLDTEPQSKTLDEALLLLSRLFGRQCALDFMRDADILAEGGTE